MQKWRYKVVAGGIHGVSMSDAMMLNIQGAEGWELVQIYKLQVGMLPPSPFMIFKQAYND